MLIDQINDVLFWILLVLVLYLAYVVLFCKGVPHITTAPVARKKAIDIIRRDMAAKGNPEHYKIIDLGCAFGYFVRDIARDIPEAHVVGIDFDGTAIAFCNIVKRLQGMKNVSYVRGDFLKYDLSDIDAVVFHMNADAMYSISEMLRASLKPGTIVICNRFKMVAGWGEPDEVEEVDTKYFKQGKINIYRA